MKFNKQTIQVLKNFSKINPSIFLRKGLRMVNTCHIDKFSYAEAMISDTIPDDIGIYDLNKFLSLIELMGEPEITYSPERSELVISNNKSTLYYATDSPGIIVYPKKQVEFPEPDVVFDVSDEHLVEMKRIIKVMNIDHISFESDNGDIYLRGYNKKSDENLERVLYSIRLQNQKTTSDFKSILRVDNVEILDLSYTVMIMSESANAIKFESPTLSYCIVLEENSTFEKIGNISNSTAEFPDVDEW